MSNEVSTAASTDPCVRLVAAPERGGRPGRFAQAVWLLGAIAAVCAPRAQAFDCNSLTRLAIKDGQVHTTTRIDSPFDPPLNETALGQDGFSVGKKPARVEQPFCRVEGLLRPSDDSFIGFEVWLPEKWNGKFQAITNGKTFGAINYTELSDGIAKGYAVVSSDLGHRSSRIDMTWAMGHPERVADFYYRADFAATSAAREVIKAFYGRVPDYSYFFGCARGGEAALMMAKRYPDLFDGIFAGSPGTDVVHQQAFLIWTAMANRDPASAITPRKFAMISKAVVAACDALDGLRDGQVTDPSTCPFKPEDIQCKSGDSDDCLTSPQVATLRKMYGGPVNPRTGEKLYDGVAAKGSELYWPPIYVGGRPVIAEAVFKTLVYQNPNWDWTQFDFDKQVDDAVQKTREFGESGSDLRQFGKHGKIIITHGWLDPLFSPVQAIRYYERTSRLTGGDISQFIKMFFAPGMGHCGGGSGPNTFDPVPALEAWVEKGIVPERIVATKYVDDDPSKPVMRTRPLCAYPKKESYIGSGDIDSENNFVCK